MAYLAMKNYCNNYSIFRDICVTYSVIVAQKLLNITIYDKTVSLELLKLLEKLLNHVKNCRKVTTNGTYRTQKLPKISVKLQKVT